MFDSDHGVSIGDQLLQLGEQFFNIGWVQARGRFIEDVEHAASTGALQLGGKFDPLCLTAGELGRWLTESNVSESHLPQHVERSLQRLVAGEKSRERHRRSGATPPRCFCPDI